MVRPYQIQRKALTTFCFSRASSGCRERGTQLFSEVAKQHSRLSWGSTVGRRPPVGPSATTTESVWLPLERLVTCG